jgi:hypothetical protein
VTRVWWVAVELGLYRDWDNSPDRSGFGQGTDVIVASRNWVVPH